jgi:hypothetical protein
MYPAPILLLFWNPLEATLQALRRPPRGSRWPLRACGRSGLDTTSEDRNVESYGTPYNGRRVSTRKREERSLSAPLFLAFLFPYVSFHKRSFWATRTMLPISPMAEKQKMARSSQWVVIA